MGLDATVMCNCFQAGQTVPPPFPRDWLEMDAEGYLTLKKKHDSDTNWTRQMAWEASCCPHPRMQLVAERIANWPDYRRFQQVLGEIGWEQFPVLHEQLPNVNGGVTPAAVCTRALGELARFAAFGQCGVTTVLVDTASGEVLYQSVADYGRIFIWAGGRQIHVGLGEHQLFAIDAASGGELFRATRIRQFRKSGTPVSGDGDDVTWENLDTGHIFESGIAISGKQIPWGEGHWEKPDGQCRFAYPAELHVEQRPKNTADFDEIVRALRSVFDAAVATGNPVRWC